MASPFPPNDTADRRALERLAKEGRVIAWPDRDGKWWRLSRVLVGIRQPKLPLSQAAGALPCENQTYAITDAAFQRAIRPFDSLGLSVTKTG